MTVYRYNPASVKKVEIFLVQVEKTCSNHFKISVVTRFASPTELELIRSSIRGSEQESNTVIELPFL